LSVQLLALLHMAEHGFTKHEHNGHACSIYLSTEQSKYCAAENPISLPHYDFIHYSITFPAPTLPYPQITHFSFTRAPPAFLLS